MSTKQFAISFTRRLFKDIPAVLAELEALLDCPVQSTITAEALREKLVRERAKKKREERRDGKDL